MPPSGLPRVVAQTPKKLKKVPLPPTGPPQHEPHPVPGHFVADQQRFPWTLAHGHGHRSDVEGEREGADRAAVAAAIQRELFGQRRFHSGRVTKL